MAFLTTERRRILPTVIFIMLLFHVVCLWAFARFLHRDAQYRLLAPEHYEAQIVTADDYRLIADPSKRSVTLSDGTRIEKSSAFEKIVVPSYKATRNGELYVSVTTKGTAHILHYVEPHYLLIGMIAMAGSTVSIWNLRDPHVTEKRADGK